MTTYRLLIWGIGMGSKYLELEAKDNHTAQSMIPMEYSIDRCVSEDKWDTYSWDNFERTTLDELK